MAEDPDRKPARRMGLAIIVGLVIAAILVFSYMRFLSSGRPDRPAGQSEAPAS